MSFEKSKLWLRTLAARPDDEHQKSRDQLRSAYLAMRQNVIPLVAAAHNDCPGLTVHDITHLDGLWEIASNVAGSDYELTPVEAFILGGAILLHDAGMAIATYDGGIEAIRATPEWRDAIEINDRHFDGQFDDDFRHKKMGRNHRENGKDRNRYNNGPERAADFVALRHLHASQAEHLATKSFQAANSEDKFYIIDNRSLRDAYGQTIGKIAHSHHWNVDQVSERLRSVIGVIPGMPTEWTANAIKVAALLRCADAAHIDASRAPTMLFSLIAPSGLSQKHWNFQNRLLQSSVQENRLIFTSSKAFEAQDSAAWWLCYETVKMIDAEIRNCNGLLNSEKLPQFEIRGVVGVESPRIFSKYVETKGWIPVDANVVVSDAQGLAATLGGRNLYGEGYESPLKELIQNSADAIRARRVLEERDSSWGQIRFTLESPEKEYGDAWLHVDDNGLGMSEAVMTGPLIDLGNSFWNSSLLSREYPGLRARHPRTIGKFGIGFFSAFLLGSEVRVASRPFRSGVNDGHVLHFQSLRERPIFRKSLENEIPMDFCTRVSIRIHNHVYRTMVNGQIKRRSDKPAQKWSYLDELGWLTATLDITVCAGISESEESMSHPWDWWTQEKGQIAHNVFSKSGLNPAAANRVGKFCDFVYSDKSIAGFGLIAPAAKKMGAEAGSVSVNGISYAAEGSNNQYHQKADEFVGIRDGNTHDASRKSAFITNQNHGLGEWATRQSQLLHGAFANPFDAMDIAERVRLLGGETADLPVALINGKFYTDQEVCEFLSNVKEVYLPLDVNYGIKIQGANKLSSTHLVSNMIPGFICISSDDVDLEDVEFDEDENEKKSEFVQTIEWKVISSEFGDASESWFVATIEKLWGNEILVGLTKINVFSQSDFDEEELFPVLKFWRP